MYILLLSMANVEHETFACDEDMYKEDGLYGDITPTDRASVAHAWTILKTLLGKHIFCVNTFKIYR